MLVNYQKLAAKLDDPNLPHSERPILEVALIMLRDFMANKTRDLKRK